MGNSGKGLSVFLLLALAASARGHNVSGHVLGPTGAGLVGVDIDVFEQATGRKLTTANDETGIGGEFDISVPAGVFRIGFDPSAAPGPTLAPVQLLDVVVSGDVDLGDVSLGYGILVTGTVVGPTGGPVPGVDLDLADPATGEKAYTPNDNTGASGDFAFAAAPGDWLVSVEPLVSTRLVALVLGPLSMPSNTDLGTIALETGVWLSGRVTSPTGAGLPAVAIGVVDSATAQAVPLEDDSTDALGGYLVVVPVGTLDVSFYPPAGSALLGTSFVGFALAADAVLDATLHPPATDPSATTIALGD
ncbi:MAG: carboxypeptidase-like regulatory domain-containing protein, partial [Planctomycetota bacterium]